MGCLSRIGCIVVLAAGGAVGYWLYGDRLPSVLSRAASGAATRVTDVATQASERFDSDSGAQIATEREATRDAERARRDLPTTWVRLAPSSAARRETGRETGREAGRAAITRWSRPNGPAYISLRAEALAGIIGAGLGRALPASASAAELAIHNELLLLRAVVALRDVAGNGTLRDVVGVAMDGRDTVHMAGSLTIVRPGLAAYRVSELRIKGFDVPPRLIPSLIGALRSAMRADSLLSSALPPGALPIPLPSSVADVRVANGNVTFYKADRP